jgi:hypothetical protein
MVLLLVTIYQYNGWDYKPVLVNTSSRLCTDFEPITPSQSNAIHTTDDLDVGGWMDSPSKLAESFKLQFSVPQ